MIFTVAFSKDGRQVLSTSDDRSVKIWNMNDEFVSKTLFGHVARVWSGLFSKSHAVSVSEVHPSSTYIRFCFIGWLMSYLEPKNGRNIGKLAVFGT